MKTVAIIQARMGSSRLPGKVLMKVAGRELLSYMLERVVAAKSVAMALVATTTNPKDDPIVAFCERNKISVFRGDENDVLDRYYCAAQTVKPDVVVRLTSDCPLIDPKIIDAVVKAHRAAGDDYTANTAPPLGTYPDGMDVEVFSFAALTRAWKEAQLPSEREHVTFYFWKTGLFKTSRVDLHESLSSFRLTVDYPEDLAVVTAVLGALYANNSLFTMRQVIDFLNAHPSIRERNAFIGWNQGWKPALEKDRQAQE